MKLFLGVILLICSSIAFTATEKMNIDTNSDQFSITLPANPTTGYRWYIKSFDKDTFNMVSRKYVATKTTRLGAGGEQTFTFQLQENKSYPKTATIVLQYARPWEQDKGTIKTLELVFKQSCECPFRSVYDPLDLL